MMTCPKCEADVLVPPLPFEPGKRYVCPSCGHGFKVGYCESHPYIWWDMTIKTGAYFTITVGEVSDD